MDDLISRSALLEELKNFRMTITGSANAIALTVMDEAKKSIMRIVEEQPVSYDVDNVIEGIKELPTRTFETYSQGYPMDEDFVDPCDVIKIVKSGGVSE